MSHRTTLPSAVATWHNTFIQLASCRKCTIRQGSSTHTAGKHMWWDIVHSARMAGPVPWWGRLQLAHLQETGFPQSNDYASAPASPSQCSQCIAVELDGGQPKHHSIHTYRHTHTLMKLMIPSGTVVLLSLHRYSMISPVCSYNTHTKRTVVPSRRIHKHTSIYTHHPHTNTHHIHTHIPHTHHTHHTD